MEVNVYKTPTCLSVGVSGSSGTILNLKWREWNRAMIKISKRERNILEKEYGLRFNDDIHGTYSKPRHYFMTEKPRNIKILNKIRG